MEVLVELIFSASGWRRVDTVGKARKLVDLDLELPPRTSEPSCR